MMPVSSEAGPYRLVRPTSAAEWDAYHAIRRRAELAGEEAGDDDDLAVGNHPLLLWHGATPVGTIRVDSLGDGSAALRLVAIDPGSQGQGHGRVLLREAEAFARGIGCGKAVVYSTPEAAGFYETAGYAEDPFDERYFGGIVQLAKPLHYAGFSLQAES